MRYLLLSDIHANRVAFEAVLRHARVGGWDEVVFLGDIVGYYNEPEVAVSILRELKPQVAILGNHDEMVLELTQYGQTRETGWTGLIAAEHAQELSDDSLRYLHSLVPDALTESFGAVHGAIRRPYEYMLSVPVARNNLPLMKRPLYFVGHTHIPSAFLFSGGRWQSLGFRGESHSITLPEDAQLFFNPGSVGQPRDGRPLASYAFYDDSARTIELHRVTLSSSERTKMLEGLRHPELGKYWRG